MPIQRRPIAGRPTNPVGLGCMSLSWAYGGRPSDEDGLRLLDRAIEVGYDHFDTARLYGLGHNETQVGKALKGKRDKVFLASKMGIFASGEPAPVISTFSGRTTGNWSSGTGTSPQVLQWMIGIGQPQ